MQISNRFTIATHMLVIIALKGKESKVTSDFLASSVGVNPVIIRKTLSQLKKADLISVARGTGGAEIIKNLEGISLLDIYQAVECLGKTGQLFSFHDNPNPDCPVGSNIHGVLDEKLDKIQEAMEEELSQTSLARVVADAEARIKE
ncbi:Rrf2 family protein [Streptococcus infantis]|uniref:Rrf2 family protein n=1 Tax=Streptococcus infantis TaxID=68892 RepID=A0A0F2DZC3_9STRE|nr:Rrf2 family transcriptional regulator [Streptococcus infantis]KJQ76388.1 Rrf2 family protein [Streptococcus infantis]SIA14880.1 Putative HTH-type transcriptional regulator ywnA [Mycobacteroides abscessus subsp. abscessus]